MALIDLTIEKPALKRSETVEEPASTDTENTILDADEAAEEPSGGTLRRTATAGVLAVGLVGLAGVLAVRKLRRWRSGD